MTANQIEAHRDRYLSAIEELQDHVEWDANTDTVTQAVTALTAEIKILRQQSASIEESLEYAEQRS